MSEEIPKVQKAVLVVEKGDHPKVKIVTDYPVPVPKENELLVKLTSSGICHSDISMMSSDWENMPMAAKVPGHEGSGYIVQQGPGVNKEQFPIGFRVGIPVVANPCRYCHNCGLPDGEVFCSNSPLFGVSKDGTWQQYMIVSTNYAIPVPDISNDFLVGPVLCGGVTVYKSLKTSKAKAGDWVVLTGAGGGLGSMGVQYAKAMGFRTIAIDTGDDKRELCLRLGAEHFIDFAKQDPKKLIWEFTNNLGAKAVISIAPIMSSYNAALGYLGVQGNLVCVGVPTTGQRCSNNWPTVFQQSANTWNSNHMI